jgi:methionyl-tRNA formyltransferase
MKIVFFGSSEFAVPSLKRLLDSVHEVVCVVTQPDRGKGRNLKVQATPVKKALKPNRVPIFQPETLRDSELQERLRSYSTDLFIVVAFGLILPEEVLGIPRLYSINLHPSLLPKYRGAAPVNWALINGETKTGLTVIRMNEKMDAGDIIMQRSLAIEERDTGETLNERLADLGSLLLLDAVNVIKEDRAKFKKQDEKKATLAPRLKKEDAIIDWNKTSKEIHDRVRGMIPWPGTYTTFANKKIIVWKTSVIDGEADPGEIVNLDDCIVVGSKEDFLGWKRFNLKEKKGWAHPSSCEAFGN